MTLPEVPGVLDADQLRTTVAAIAAEQAADGALPWHRGGQLDAWDSVEAAMALDVGGEHDRALAAYGWLARHQRPDGSVTVPEVLRPYLGGLEVLEPVA